MKKIFQAFGSFIIGPIYICIACVGAIGLGNIGIAVFLLGVVPLLMGIAWWNSDPLLAAGFFTALLLLFVGFMAWGMIFWKEFPGPDGFIFRTFHLGMW